MVSYVFVMIIPLLVLIHTLSFARWMRGRHERDVQIFPVYVVSCLSFVLSGYVLWRMYS